MERLGLRVAANLALVLFFFASSNARSLFNSPARGRFFDNPTSESDAKPTILLPGDRLVESGIVKSDEPGQSGAKSAEIAELLPESEKISTTSVPLTVLNFRPINRHFPHKHPYQPFRVRFRIPHRCHHHFKPMDQRLSSFREISYGNDMVVSGQEARSDEPFGTGLRQLPVKWFSFHEGRQMFPNEQDHLHQETDRDNAMEWKEYRQAKEVKHRESEERKDGFMNRVRKFLNHHF